MDETLADEHTYVCAMCMYEVWFAREMLNWFGEKKVQDRPVFYILKF